MKGSDEKLRLTVLNLYVKLSGMGFWKFVGTPAGIKTGEFNFNCTDEPGLRDTLRKHDDFSDPGEKPGNWDSREQRSSGSLHFKRFGDIVQAHIDQIGLLPKSKAWWLMPVIPLGHMIAHGATYDSYQDVFGIRDILLGQGWDPAPLKGVQAAGGAQ